MLCEQMLDLGFGREPVLEFVAGGKTALLGTMLKKEALRLEMLCWPEPTSLEWRSFRLVL